MDFDKAVKKILQQYADGVISDTNQLTKKFGQLGAKDLRANSGFNTGAYAKGWKSKFEERRLGSSAIIYNEKAGLPHLLENGHALRNGGRTAGRTHIAPVEEKLVKEYVEAVKKTI